MHALFSSYFIPFLCIFEVITDFVYTPAHNDFQYSMMNNYICIPDWLPKGTVQVFDCNFDPTPAEMLLFTTEKRRFLSVYQV